MSTWYSNDNIDKAISAFDEYLKKQKESQTTLSLWDDQQDINLVIEPKVICRKAPTFKSIRVYVIYNFADHE